MPSTRTALAAAAALVALSLAPVHAQAQPGRIAVGGSRVPPGHLPPAGLCRVWYDGVPPGRQPAPVDCDVAERQAARGGRSASVIYGSNARRDGRWERDDDRRGQDDGGWWEREDARRRDDDGRYDARYPNGDYPYPDARTGDGRNRAGERADARYEGRYDPRYDGRYDGRTDRRLPVMPSAAVLRRGGGEDVRWLGRGDWHARWSDANRDGRPEQVVWRDARGVIVQRWVDLNRDGRTDRVTYFSNGRAVRTVD